jgi:putative ABC transport system ATP-binding protein
MPPFTPGAAADVAVRINNLRFSYPTGQEVLAIDSLCVSNGKNVFLHGPSGSGKTTLLGLVGGILAATSGEVLVLGANLKIMSPTQRDAFRGKNIGYIFQMFNLIPYLTVEENILLPLRMGVLPHDDMPSHSDIASRLNTLVNSLGLSEKLKSTPTTLSVGQQQRVAAARALLLKPRLLIADEPTSSLDAHRRTDFIKLLFEQCHLNQTTLIFVSHDKSLQSLFDESISLPDLNKISGSISQ